MSKLVSRAAFIVANYHNARRIANGDRAYGAAFKGLLEAITAELGRKGAEIHALMEKDSNAIGEIQFFGLVVEDIPRVTFQLSPAPDGAAWTTDRLRAFAVKGNGGLLDQPTAWMDPRIEGAARMFIWWGSPRLWGKAAAPEAEAVRLAWETIADHSRTWWFEQVYRLDQSAPWYDANGDDIAGMNLDEARFERMREVRERALDYFPRIWTPPEDLPLSVLRDAIEASPLQAIAYYLMESPVGPGLSPTQASRAVGRNWREMKKALSKYLEYYPKAARWPKRRPRPYEIREIPVGDVGEHH